MPDIDRVEASVEGKGLKMAPSPPGILTMKGKGQVAQEASGPSWHPAFLFVRMKRGGRDGGTRDSAGEWSSSEVCGFLKEISTVKLKSWQ